CNRCARVVVATVIRIVDQLRHVPHRILGRDTNSGGEVEQITSVGRIGRFDAASLTAETTHTSSLELVPVTIELSAAQRRDRGGTLGGFRARRNSYHRSRRERTVSAFYCSESVTTTLCFTAPLTPVKRKVTKPGASLVEVVTVTTIVPDAGAGLRE